MSQDYQIAVQEALAKQQAQQQSAFQNAQKAQTETNEKKIGDLKLGPMNSIIARNNPELLDDPDNFKRYYTPFSAGKTGIKKSAIRKLEKEKELQGATLVGVK